MPAKKKIKDADLQRVGPALERAASRAREIARKTGTCLVVYENGKVVRKPVK